MTATSATAPSAATIEAIKQIIERMLNRGDHPYGCAVCLQLIPDVLNPAATGASV